MKRRSLALLLPLLAAAGPARAATLAAPAGPVLLSIAGRITRRNQGDRADYDAALLDALPQHTIVARTPWYADQRRFTGPLLRALLEQTGAEGTMLRAAALNDYRVDIPVEDVRRHDVIVARLLDDKPMPVRDKGPLFVMYPFDRDPELRTAVYFSRCIWQLRALEVL